MQKTVVLIKPDTVQRGLIGEIISRFERKGLKILELVMFSCWRDLAEQIYKVHKDKPFFNGQVEFMISGPIVLLILEGKDAVAHARLIAGDIGTPGTIRGDYSISIRHNIVHASDTVENAAYEVALFDTICKHFSYVLDSQKWIYTKQETAGK